jgi:adenylate cyclase
MPQPVEANADEHSEEWRETLTHGHSVKSLKVMKRVMRLLPGPPRCKVCNNPFGGIGGRLCQLVGFAPSKKNPRICSLCCESMPRGGAEIETAILFADIRGSTELAARLGAVRFAEILNRFYSVATEVLINRDATVDKLIGDEVMAFFVPGFAGSDFKRKSIDAGQALIRAFGYGGREQPWLPVGIGIDVGVAYVGNVGGEHIVDFTALGDPVNMAEHIQAKAQPGELLVSASAFAAVAEQYPECQARYIKMGGKDIEMGVYSLPVT